jgi:hypothetical protein
MADYPPLSRYYIASYAANDRDYPVVLIRLDPRTAGYKVPEDLSPHPDSKRYPNHVFTGAQPASGDQVVTHVYEILPAPYVPFTRYDDDLGPIQGRRRSVKNEGQVARLGPDQRVNYEAREGSAIVYTEIEESWSIETDDDGNSLFPIRDRDFYDASRGPVQERRQLFVPTGEEEGTLENINGVITQTSYEPYNEYLSVKVVQTYSVDGPLLIGKATDNEGQLVTVTTQRKGAQRYNPPNPTATKTVEVEREDAESLIERVVDTPQVFGAEIYRKTREDLTPQKFKAAQEDSTVEENVEGTANPSITLETGEFAKSEQQVSKFVKRVSLTSRSTTVNPDPLVEKVLTNEGKVGTRTLTLVAGPQSFEPSAKLIDANVEALGDGRTVKSETVVDGVFNSLTKSAQKPDTIPEKFRINSPIKRTEETIEKNDAEDPNLGQKEYSKTEQRLTEFTVQKTTTEREDNFNEVESLRLEENWGIQIPYTEYISQTIPSGDNYEAEGLDDKNHLVREYNKEDLESTLSSFSVTIPTSIDLDLPRILKDIKIEWQSEKSSSISETDTTGIMGSFKSLTQQDDGEVSSNLTLIPKVEIDFEDIWGKNLPATIHLFFLKKEELNESKIREMAGATESWPIFKPQSYVKSIFGKSEYKRLRAYVSRAIEVNSTDDGYGYQPSKGTKEDTTIALNPVFLNIPPCLTKEFNIDETEEIENDSTEIELKYDTIRVQVRGNSFDLSEVEIIKELNHTMSCDVSFRIPATSPDDVPRSGEYLISSSAEPYKFGWFLVRAITFDASIL